MPQANPPETTLLPSGVPEELMLRVATNTGKQVVFLRAAASITSCLQEVQGLGSQPPTEREKGGTSGVQTLYVAVVMTMRLGWC